MIIDRQNENDRLERMRNIYLQVHLLLIQKVALNKLKNVLQIAKIAMSRFTLDGGKAMISLSIKKK